MYQIVKNMLNEDDVLKVWRKDVLFEDRSTWWELNIDSTTIAWQQEIRATAKKVNKFSKNVKKDVSCLKDCLFEQQQ